MPRSITLALALGAILVGGGVTILAKVAKYALRGLPR